MSETIAFEQKLLIEIRIGESHERVHAAWRDDTNEGFLICNEINLIFNDQSIFEIKPCEVEVAGRYPSLSLSVNRIDSTNLHKRFQANDLPMKIKEVVQTDYLGEDTPNQLEIVLQNASKIIIRHVFPPMTMGIRLE
ncbi:hypothetical protein [Pseudidiomarina aestuarii]|uniref:hypothetical protein n=1 Tax=Pseudidiomarina aestuarii TaxID=624146 RepID=UPI003A96E5C0